MANEDGPLDDKILAKFDALFWKAREEIFRAGKKEAKQSKAYRDALEYAKQHDIPTVFLEATIADANEDTDAAELQVQYPSGDIPPGLLGTWNTVKGSLFSLLGRHEEAETAYRTAINTKGFSNPDAAWNNLGNLLSDLGKHEEAEAAYRTAIDTEGFSDPGMVWNNLGNLLTNKGRHEEAEAAYRNAIDTKSNSDPGMAWSSLGNLLTNKGRHEEAEAAYRNAIDTKGYSDPGAAWNNLGNLLSDQGRHEEAEAAYRNAIDTKGYSNPGMAWNNLGILLREQGRHEEAVQSHQNALTSPDSDGTQHSRAKSLLRIAESGLGDEALNERDRLLSDPPPTGTRNIEDRILAKIQESETTQYDRYSERQNHPPIKDGISILRGWSSAVTLLEGTRGRWLGGGYFLRWRDKGLVIDPGFDFLRNFHDCGFHGREIDAVFVSHDHPDHNNDLASIDDLRYELYKRRNTNPIQPYCLVLDGDTYASQRSKFITGNPEHHLKPIHCATGNPGVFDLTTDDLPFRITPFDTDHRPDVPQGIGATIELLDSNGETVRRIGYTGDTTYSNRLAEPLADCDVLIAHISQPALAELKDPNESHGNHLGYRGTIKLLKDTKPKLALIGEFWAGFADLRIDLVNAIRDRTELKCILPAGIGLDLSLPELRVYCTECRATIPPSSVIVAPPPSREPYGNLSFLCRSCMVS